MDNIWETWINLSFFYIKMSYGYWKQTGWSVNNQKSSICKWAFRSEMFLVSFLDSKSFIYFGRSLGKALFWMHSFISLILFLVYIFYASSFSCFLIMLTTNHQSKGKKSYIKKQTWNDFYHSPQFRPFPPLKLSTLKNKSRIWIIYEKHG